MNAEAVWHDVECGRYEADLPLWRERAAGSEGVLDVGAGTGRVALDLAQAGHPVIALDLEPELLAVLSERAALAGVTIPTVAADASEFTLAEPVDLIVVPMQTLQLLDDRDGFFASARGALKRGGRLAAAIATGLEPFDGTIAPLPPPDLGLYDGYRFVSQPVAIRVEDGRYRLERVRHLIAPDGTSTAADDVITLHAVSPGELAEEAARHGLEAESLLHIPETAEHVGAEVVVFRG
jgi:SAM-dependent methyltransferase